MKAEAGQASQVAPRTDMSAGGAEQRPGRTLLVVVGTGRSGTSLLTGLLHELGYAVPQPELGPNKTNPRGFGEPRWVVRFHKQLMEREGGIFTLDSRPGMIDRADKVARHDGTRRQLGRWLAGQYEEADHVVVKDPRIGYFLSLWRECAREVGADVATLTMLRHPAEILDSLDRAYGPWQKPASRLSAWLNMMLHVEQVTRDLPRAFIRHVELLADWQAALKRAGKTANLSRLVDVTTEQERRIADFVEPSLHRSTTSWSDFELPGHVRDLADAVWADLNELVEAPDSLQVRERLERAQQEYVQLYRDAQAVAQLSISAARRDGRAAAEAEYAEQAAAAGSAGGTGRAGDVAAGSGAAAGSQTGAGKTVAGKTSGGKTPGGRTAPGRTAGRAGKPAKKAGQAAKSGRAAGRQSVWRRIRRRLAVRR